VRKVPIGKIDKYELISVLPMSLPKINAICLNLLHYNRSKRSGNDILKCVKEALAFYNSDVTELLCIQAMSSETAIADSM